MNTEESIENIYKILEERSKTLEQQGKGIEANQENISTLMTALLGDDFGNHGFGDRIGENESEIEDLKSSVIDQEHRFNRIYSKIIGICIGVSVTASLLIFLIRATIFQPKKVRKKKQTANSFQKKDADLKHYTDVTPTISKAIKPEKIKLKNEYYD